jgi:hypothetical protein
MLQSLSVLQVGRALVEGFAEHWLAEQRAVPVPSGSQQ